MEHDPRTRLQRAAGTYTGSGVNHERESFTAELRLEVVAGGNAVAARFRAIDASGTVLHDEHAIVAPSMEGALTYHPVSNNIPFLLPHVLETDEATDTLTFASGDFGSPDGFREKISITLGEGSVEYAYSWGMPGDEFGERSRVSMKRTDG